MHRAEGVTPDRLRPIPMHTLARVCVCVCMCVWGGEEDGDEVLAIQ